MANEIKPPADPTDQDKEQKLSASDAAKEPQSPKEAGPRIEPPSSPATEANRAALETSPLSRQLPAPAKTQLPSDAEVEREMRRRTRRSFLVGGAAAIAGLGLGRWLITRRDEDGTLWPLRRVLEINQEFATDYFSDQHLAKTFPASEAVELRQNGDEGMDDDFDPANWRLELVGLANPSAFQESSSANSGSANSDNAGSQSTSSQDAGGGDDDTGDDDDDDDDDDTSDSTNSDSVYLTLNDIRSLPRVELVAEFKCIEGWSQIVQWAGARFADFAAKYGPATTDGSAPDVRKNPRALVRYVYMETPGAGYYVGLDMKSALHPQTLLCYEMNGKPLALEHGAPLRLVTPVKYGIKNIKRIGKIRFTDTRPADFWAERGYDWYAGL